MKKQFLTRAISKGIFTVAFIAIFSMSQNVYALPDKPVNKEAEITYRGSTDNKLMFNINYKNELAEKFFLTIKNELGEIIYSKQYESKPLNKTMSFSEFPENGKLTFVIATGKKEFSQTFSINSQVKTVEEFIVKGI